MLKINIQLFAHKKEWDPPKTGGIPNPSGWASNVPTDSLCSPAISWCASGHPIHPGLNVGIGSDDTLFAKADGTVRFERMGKDRKRVRRLRGRAVSSGENPSCRAVRRAAGRFFTAGVCDSRIRGWKASIIQQKPCILERMNPRPAGRDAVEGTCATCLSIKR